MQVYDVANNNITTIKINFSVNDPRGNEHCLSCSEGKA